MDMICDWTWTIRCTVTCTLSRSQNHVWFCIIPALPVDLQSTGPDLRLDMIRMAVLKIMDMNSSLYSHLHSDTFDVPDYEKENMLYNNEVYIYL